MRWSDNFKRSFDFTYELVKMQDNDIRFPCYGGRLFYSFSYNRRFNICYLYLTSSSLVYTYSGGHVYKIPFNEMTNLTVERGLLFKTNIHIRFRADSKYHFVVYDLKDFSTELTGDGSENLNAFINTLQSKVKPN